MHKRMTRARRSHERQGFSLVELMMVVAIIGVLSAIAIPTFGGYVRKSRASEAMEFLGTIKLREESYRSEFGSYCPTVPTAGASGVADLDSLGNLLPDISTTPPKHSDQHVWAPVAGSAWTQLGARPAGRVRFGYGVAAGPPTGLPAAVYGWTTANADFWFISRAVGDLDDDNTLVTFESYSATRNIYCTEAKGWE